MTGKIDEFQLSRVYAQGWSAAKKLLADGNFGMDETHAAALSPYRSASESARWIEGFGQALRSRTGSPNKAGGSVWMPSARAAASRLEKA